MLLALVAAPPALAVPACPDAQPATTILRGQGSMESVIAGPDGKLYFTDSDKRALMRLDAPGAQPVPLATGIDSPGGLLVSTDGKSLVQGYGSGAETGAAGNLVGLAGLLRIDLATGAKTTIATGTSMSNGLARDPSGAIYASNSAGAGIDRVVGGRVQPRWATVVSGNGLAVESTGRYVLVNQTFQPAAIQRVDITNPESVERYAAPGPEDSAAGLDGLTTDQSDRLFAAANAVGEVWRISIDRSICALARGLKRPSAVAFGNGGAFPATSLYVVGFGGEIVELPAARPQPAVAPAPRPPRLHLRVRPRFLRAKRRTRVTVVVRRGANREPGARVRIGRRSTRTGQRGRAHLWVHPRKAGRLIIRVRAPGARPLRFRLRVLRANPGSRPRARID